MATEVRLSRTAQREYDEATEWYDQHRASLGAKFVSAVERKLTEIGNYPDRYPVVEDDVRETLLPKKWPYTIYYRVRTDHILVISVFHQSRDPSVWQSRI
jgi:toxin ParE1/3/4